MISLPGIADDECYSAVQWLSGACAVTCSDECGVRTGREVPWQKKTFYGNVDRKSSFSFVSLPLLLPFHIYLFLSDVYFCSVFRVLFVFFGWCVRGLFVPFLKKKKLFVNVSAIIFISFGSFLSFSLRRSLFAIGECDMQHRDKAKRSYIRSNIFFYTWNKKKIDFCELETLRSHIFA